MCYSIDIIKKVKIQFMDWKKIFIIHITDKGFFAGKYMKLEMCSLDPPISPLAFYPREMKAYIHKKTSTIMLITTFF